MIKPLSPSVFLVRFVRDPLSLFLLHARFRGQKSALRGDRTQRAPSSERERASSSQVPSDSLSRTPLLFSATARFLLRPSSSSSFFFCTAATTTNTTSSSYSGDGGFQRDVLAAANSMRDESGTVTDTAGQRSIAGSYSLIERNLRTTKWHMLYIYMYI